MPKQQLDIIAENLPHLRPEFYRLPDRDSQDPFFGCTRAAYYQLEKDGDLRLIRRIPKGKKKGIVWVRYADMAELMNRLADVQQGKAQRRKGGQP